MVVRQLTYRPSLCPRADSYPHPSVQQLTDTPNTFDIESDRYPHPFVIKLPVLKLTETPALLSMKHCFEVVNCYSEY